MVAAQRDVDCARSRRQVVSRVEHLGENSKTTYRKSNSSKFNASRSGQPSKSFKTPIVGIGTHLSCNLVQAPDRIAYGLKPDASISSPPTQLAARLVESANHSCRMNRRNQLLAISLRNSLLVPRQNRASQTPDAGISARPCHRFLFFWEVDSATQRCSVVYRWCSSRGNLLEPIK